MNPGQTFDYRVKLTVIGPGPFESGISIFLHENGIREVEIGVKGTGVEAGDGR